MSLRRQLTRTTLPGALTLASLLLLLASGAADKQAAGQSAAVVSVDAQSSSQNTATQVGTIDACHAVTQGDTLVSDVVIEGVTDLSAFQADLEYDSTVLRLVTLSLSLTVDYELLLASTGTAVLDLGEGLPDDGDGSFSFAAAQFPATPASGSGVLVRFKLEALATGSSPLSLAGVKLSDGSGAAIQPSDSNNFYTGPIAGATVVVDSSCDELDTDGDGWTDADESIIGTAPASACPATADADDEDPDPWPPDFDDNRSINTIDVFQVLPPHFGTTVPPTDARRDLSPDGSITTIDVFAVLPPVYGSVCAP